MLLRQRSLSPDKLYLFLSNLSLPGILRPTGVVLPKPISQSMYLMRLILAVDQQCYDKLVEDTCLFYTCSSHKTLDVTVKMPIYMIYFKFPHIEEEFVIPRIPTH